MTVAFLVLCGVVIGIALLIGGVVQERSMASAGKLGAQIAQGFPSAGAEGP